MFDWRGPLIKSLIAFRIDRREAVFLFVRPLLAAGVGTGRQVIGLDYQDKPSLSLVSACPVSNDAGYNP